MPYPDIVPQSTQVDPAFWMRAAQAAVRRECGWHVAPVITETLVLDGQGGKLLLLPTLRIVSVTKVVNAGVDVTDLVRSGPRSGVLLLETGWACAPGSVEVTLEHGFAADEAADVAGLIVTLTKRASQGAAAGLTVRQNIGPAGQSLAIGKDGATLGVPLLQSEKDLLRPYAMNWGP